MFFRAKQSFNLQAKHSKHLVGGPVGSRAGELVGSNHVRTPALSGVLGRERSGRRFAGPTDPCEFEAAAARDQWRAEHAQHARGCFSPGDRVLGRAVAGRLRRLEAKFVRQASSAGMCSEPAPEENARLHASPAAAAQWRRAGGAGDHDRRQREAVCCESLGEPWAQCSERSAGWTLAGVRW